MNRIIINDVDQTTNQATTINSDVVYIPGFAVQYYNSKGELSPATLQPARTPKLCTSLQEFREAFGSTPAQFLVDQLYPEHGTTTPGFLEDAIPTDTGQSGVKTWFNGGTPDPSYVYAIDVLSAGLPVIYERVNERDLYPTFVDNYNTENSTNAKVILYSENRTYPTISASDTSPVNFVVYNNKYYELVLPQGETSIGPEPFDATHWVEIDASGNKYPAFDRANVYEVGDTVKNTANNKYYRCMEETTAGENFNAEQWIEVDMSKEWYDVTVERFYSQVMATDGIYSVGNKVEPNPVIPGPLSDVSAFDIKYITSGGYPTYEYKGAGDNGEDAFTKLSLLASSRGDALAFIDHTDNRNRPLVGEGSVYEAIKDLGVSDKAGANCSTMITPYGNYNTATVSNFPMPGSFGYIMALARSIRSNYNWLPIAGIVRGYVPGLVSLRTYATLTNSVADYYQQGMDSLGKRNSINAITYINDQGYTIWGNRTLQVLNGEGAGFASTFLNMRNLICDVKKRAYRAAQKCLFEQNTDTLWLNFQSDIMGLLDQMKAGNIIKYYKILKIETTDKTKLAARIQIAPIYAVETVEIEIYLTDEDAIVE